MKNLIVVFLIAISSISFAQPIDELGVSYGQAYYIGDLNPNAHFNFKLYNHAYSIFHRYNYNSRWAWRNQFVYTKVNGDDAIMNNPVQNARNLSFSSTIYELATGFEFNFLKYSLFNEQHYYTPYLFWGISAFHYTPTAELGGNTYDLRPLMTEGQTEPYKKIGLALPIAVGIKFKYNRFFSFHIEYGIRKTSTDFLDDVSGDYPDPDNLSKISASLSNRSTNKTDGINSNWLTQRGNSNDNDQFSVLNIGVSIKVGKNPNLCHFNPLN